MYTRVNLSGFGALSLEMRWTKELCSRSECQGLGKGEGKGAGDPMTPDWRKFILWLKKVGCLLLENDQQPAFGLCFP